MHHDSSLTPIESTKYAVTFQSLINNLTNDTLQISLPLFRPELVLCATIVVMLLVRVFRLGDKLDPFWLALIGSAVGLLVAPRRWQRHRIDRRRRTRQEIFTGMLVYDSFTVFFRMFLLAFAFWFIILARITGLPDREDGPDFYTLLLGATLGMCLMASANHLLTVFLGVEMASVPSYALAGMLKGRRRASEAALKYAVYGAGAAGVMLYGISLLAGVLGSAHLPTIAAQLAAMDIPGMIGRGDGGGTLMVLGPRRPDDRWSAWRSSSRPCRSTSGAPTCSKAQPPRSTRSCRSPRRPPRWRCWSASPSAFSTSPAAAPAAQPVATSTIDPHRVPLTRSPFNSRPQPNGSRPRCRNPRRARLHCRPAPGPQLHRPAAGDHGRGHLHVRQPGRLRPERTSSGCWPIRRSPTPAT